MIFKCDNMHKYDMAASHVGYSPRTSQDITPKQKLTLPDSMGRLPQVTKLAIKAFYG